MKEYEEFPKFESEMNVIINNLSWENDKYTVCNEAVAIPDGYKPKNGTSEIELVLINPDEKILYLAFYDYSRKSVFDEKYGIKAVCEDYIDIFAHMNKPEFVKQMIHTYNNVRNLLGKQIISDDNASEYTVRILFILTKTSEDNNNSDDNLNENDFEAAMDIVREIVKEKHFNKITIFRYFADTPDDVELISENFEVL